MQRNSAYNEVITPLYQSTSSHSLGWCKLNGLKAVKCYFILRLWNRFYVLMDGESDLHTTRELLTREMTFELLKTTKSYKDLLDKGNREGD